MKTKTLRLNNDFHNTAVDLKVEHYGAIEVNDIIHVSKGQAKKSKDTLCCEDCICSGYLGDRAAWHKLGDTEVKLCIDEMPDGSARLSVEEIFE